MAKNIKKEVTEVVSEAVAVAQETATKPSINDLGWTDYVLSLLSDDEKIADNPTTDGLRRVFEIALDCCVTEAKTEVVQTPEPNNEKRATVVHTISYILKNLDSEDDNLKYRSVSGAADVYWGNCDKIYRNHPVAVAETRAEGRALRRALKLRKVVAAEEIAKDIDDHPDAESVNKITNNQINFIDTLSNRLNINVIKLLEHNNLDTKNVYGLSHDDAVSIIRVLSGYQQNMQIIPDLLIGYSNEWK
jgi:hypothetical protein